MAVFGRNEGDSKEKNVVFQQKLNTQLWILDCKKRKFGSTSVSKSVRGKGRLIYVVVVVGIS